MTLTTAKWLLDDYHRMIAAGILAGRLVELLDGEIVEMVPEEEPHAYFSDEAGEYLVYLLGNQAKVRQGKPITLHKVTLSRNLISLLFNVSDELTGNITLTQKISFG